VQALLVIVAVQAVCVTVDDTVAVQAVVVREAATDSTLANVECIT
jgi:hypothetical protein